MLRIYGNFVVMKKCTTVFPILTGGILNANAKQLQNKWHNVKFNAKGKGRPNPYTDPNWDKDQDVISEQLQPYKELLEDENVEREIEAHLQQVSQSSIYL